MNLNFNLTSKWNHFLYPLNRIIDAIIIVKHWTQWNHAHTGATRYFNDWPFFEDFDAITNRICGHTLAYFKEENGINQSAMESINFAIAKKKNRVAMHHSPNLHSKFSTLDVISLTQLLINSLSTMDVPSKLRKQTATAKYVWPYGASTDINTSRSQWPFDVKRIISSLVGWKFLSSSESSLSNSIANLRDHFCSSVNISYWARQCGMRSVWIPITNFQFAFNLPVEFVSNLGLAVDPAFHWVICQFADMVYLV